MRTCEIYIYEIKRKEKQDTQCKVSRTSKKTADARLVPLVSVLKYLKGVLPPAQATADRVREFTVKPASPAILHLIRPHTLGYRYSLTTPTPPPRTQRALLPLTPTTQTTHHPPPSNQHPTPSTCLSPSPVLFLLRGSGRGRRLVQGRGRWEALMTRTRGRTRWPLLRMSRRCHSATTQAGSLGLTLRRRCPCRTVSCAARWPTSSWPSTSSGA